MFANFLFVCWSSSAIHIDNIHIGMVSHSIRFLSTMHSLIPLNCVVCIFLFNSAVCMCTAQVNWNVYSAIKYLCKNCSEFTMVSFALHEFGRWEKYGENKEHWSIQWQRPWQQQQQQHTRNLRKKTRCLHTAMVQLIAPYIQCSTFNQENIILNGFRQMWIERKHEILLLLLPRRETYRWKWFQCGMKMGIVVTV